MSNFDATSLPQEMAEALLQNLALEDELPSDLSAQASEWRPGGAAGGLSEGSATDAGAPAAGGEAGGASPAAAEDGWDSYEVMAQQLLSALGGAVCAEAVGLALDACSDSFEDAEEVLRRAAFGAAPGAPPCKFFLMGQCRRADCAFGHDRENALCRYWLRGACAIGSDCMFLHGLPRYALDAVRRADPPEKGFRRADPPDPPRDAASWPSLPRPEAFPALPAGAPPPREDPQDAARDIAARLFHSRPAPRAAAPAAAPRAAAAPARVGKARLGSRELEGLWVEGGSGVAASYAANREAAKQLAIRRNAQFARATSAFRAGKKAEAKRLGAEGRRLDALMRREAGEAGQRIFRERNKEERVFGRGVVDLHGLHKDEATGVLEELLPRMRDRGLELATVVTGTGSHTLGPQKGRARLLPGLQAALAEWNVAFRAVPDRNGHVGALQVRLETVSW